MIIKELLIASMLTVVLIGFSSDEQSLSPLNSNAVIMAFGDSLTYGKGVEQDSYPSQLQKMMDISVVNKGVSGEVSSKGLQRLPSDLANVQPDLVILCHGGNDILKKLDKVNLKNNLEAMITLIRSSGAQVILLGVPKPGIFLSSISLYNELSEKMGVPIENEVIAKVLSKNSLKSDHVHPNKKGYKKIAEAVFNLLKNEGAVNN